MRMSCVFCQKSFNRKARTPRTDRPNANQYRAYCSSKCYAVGRMRKDKSQCLQCTALFTKVKDKKYCTMYCYRTRNQLLPPLEIYGDGFEFMRIYRQHKYDKIRHTSVGHTSVGGITCEQ